MPITTTTYGFTPTTINNCALWLDGADSSQMTFSSGNNMSTWQDKSGQGKTMTAVGSPVYQGTSGGVYLNGTSQYFSNATSVLNNTYTIFFVYNKTSTSVGNLYSCYNSSANTSGYTGFFPTEGANYYLVRSDTSWATAASTIPNNNKNIVSVQYENNIVGGPISVVYNGSDNISSTQTGTITYLNFTIGYRSYGSGPYLEYTQGYFYEIVAYSIVLTLSQRQQVESYLAQKWGITLSLAGHPGLTSTVYQSTYLKTAGPKRNIATMTPFYTAFTPRQIGGLALWLDGADPAGNGVIPANNTTLTVWKDKSGIGNDATAYGSPKYNSKYISFSASTSDYVRTSAYLTITQNVTTVFYVAQLNSVAAFDDLIAFTDIAWGSYTGANSIRYYQGLLVGTVSRVGDTYDFGLNNYYINGTFNPSSTPSYSTPHIVNAVSQNTGGSTRVSVSDTAFSRYFTGNVYEVLIYNSVINSTQRQQVESYLAQKWGLTSSLPGGHLNATQPAGANTSLSLANSRMTLTKFGVAATGGTVTTANGYKIHTFTSVGSTNFVVTSGGSVQVLVVGGGGGGGGYYNGGGGGAGGAIYNSAFSVSITSYTVTVGNGGAGASGGNNPGINGTSGGASTFSTLTGNGGGGGGADNYVNGLTGGCGGGMGPLGASAPGSGNQGYAGGYGTNGPNMGTLGGAYGSGYGGGGGGGMGSVGSNALTSSGPGWGGTGYTYVVGGQNYLVAGGGGGGTADTDNTNFGLGGSSIGGVGGLNTARSAGNGAANTGSGGGGYGRVGTGSAGGTGGTGIVVIAYRI